MNQENISPLTLDERIAHLKKEFPESVVHPIGEMRHGADSVSYSLRGFLVMTAEHIHAFDDQLYPLGNFLFEQLALAAISNRTHRKRFSPYVAPLLKSLDESGL